MKRRRYVSLLASACVVVGLAVPASAALDSAERTALEGYLSAIHQERYDRAFGLLTPDERRYFGSVDNFASVFRADPLRLDSFRVLADKRDPAHGAVAEVAETVHFYDHAHQSVARGSVTVPYGIVGVNDPRIKDPYHPWRAVAPANTFTERDGLRVTIRKVSFFSGRLELLATFANYGSRPTTILPYGRSVLRDENDRAYAPLETRLPSVTDRVLFSGLRLPPRGQYTGFLTFATPARFQPARLAFVIGPALQDGSEAPMALRLPDVVVAQ